MNHIMMFFFRFFSGYNNLNKVSCSFIDACNFEQLSSSILLLYNMRKISSNFVNNFHCLLSSGTLSPKIEPIKI